MKKVLSSVLALSLVLISASCAGGSSLNDSKREEALDACSDIASYLCDRDAVRLENVVDGRFDTVSSSIVFDDDTEDADDITIREKIASTMTYEIHEDSLTDGQSGNDVYVDVDFSIVDYQALFDSTSFSDASSAVDALDSFDQTVTIPYSMHLVFKNDMWMLYNFESIPELYPYDHATFTFAQKLSDLITGSVWDEATGDSYENACLIRLKVYFDGDLIGDRLDYYYTVECGEETLFESEITTDNTPEEVMILYSNGVELLPEGTYTITMYDEGGNEIFSSQCTNVYTYSLADLGVYTNEDLGLKFTPPSGFNFLREYSLRYNYLSGYGDNEPEFVACRSTDTVIILDVDSAKGYMTEDVLESFANAVCDDLISEYDTDEYEYDATVSEVSILGNRAYAVNVITEDEEGIVYLEQVFFVINGYYGCVTMYSSTDSDLNPYLDCFEPL